MGVFLRILRQCLDSYIPLKKIYRKYSKRHTPWLTDELLSKIHAKNKAKRHAEHSKDPSDIFQYKVVKNKLKSAIRSAKLEYLRSLLSRAHQAPRFAATLWSEINDIVGHPKKQPPVLDSRLSLNEINQFFRTVAVSANHRTADCFVSPPSSCDKQLF